MNVVNNAIKNIIAVFFFRLIVFFECKEIKKIAIMEEPKVVCKQMFQLSEMNQKV